LLVKALVTMYIVGAALLPLSHHDVVCHLKSPTHCTTCLTTMSGEAAPHVASLDVWRLVDAGHTTAAERGSLRSAHISSPTGRAPPALA
jgi:hypothetical protein